MNKFNLTKELVKIANILDSSKMHIEANSLTKIAEDMMDDDVKTMPYNPDDQKSDMMDNKADDFDNLIDMLIQSHENGELDDEDMASIMNLLHSESGKGHHEMSYQNDEYNTEDYGICPDCGEYLEDGVCEDCGYGEDEDMDDDDFELGLGAVPHKRIKNPSKYDVDSHNDDYDISLADDEDDF